MRLSIFLMLSFLCINLQAQVISDFKLLDVVSNDSVSLNKFSKKQGVAVIFVSNECAFDTYYASRIKSLVEMYSDKIQFLLINSNQEPEESIEQMRGTIAKRKINAPYLADKKQVALNSLGAKKTPEVFLLSPHVGKFIVFYSGAIDDNPQVETDAKQEYLKDNITKLLTGQQASEIVRAVGCTIRKG